MILQDLFQELNMTQINQISKKKISYAEKRIPDTSGLVKKTDLNSRIAKIESKIPSITGSVTNAALTAVKNKIPDVSNLVKKTDYNTKLKLKTKSVTMIMINILLLQNLISFQQKILKQD